MDGNVLQSDTNGSARGMERNSQHRYNIIGGFVGWIDGWLDGWMAVVVVDLFGLNRHEGGEDRERE